MLSVFLGTCEAVSCLHHYVAGPSSSSSSYPPPAATTPTQNSMSVPNSKGIRTNDEGGDEFDDDDDDGETLVMTGNEGEALIGGIATAKAELEEEEGPDDEGESPSTERKLQPFAHRDIKPVRFYIAFRSITLCID
jgi:hypothetical protein